MSKEMLINVSEGEECRIALVENGRLEELYMERTSATSHVGNIYKGRVTNVEPSIQAAFIDFGLGRNGFLHISDLMPTYFGRAGSDVQETVGRKMARRDRPPIQRCLRRGDEIIVQIIKEGIGTKGPTLTSYISIPGRILVMMPGMGKMGVSKKIEDEEERRRLRKILDGLKPPKGVAFIIRTAGIGKAKTEIERDLKYLTRLWETIEKKQKEPGPVELYTEGDLVTRTVRDVFTSDVERIVVDSKDVAKRVKDVIKITAPRTKNKVDVYDEPVPLFHKYGIEKDIEMMYSRHVPLPSGGSLVIDSTEAIVAIDVNSGKNRESGDAETTAFRVDMEAADEICRQLKLRDLGGVVICDFIDLRYERHRRELEKRLDDNFRRDRAKTKVLRMSQFGIIELTRQRMRPSLKRSVYFDCPHCKGAGLVKTPESMALDVMRKVAIAAADLKVARVEVSVCPDVAFYLLNKKRRALTELEEESSKKILIRSDASLGLDETKFGLFDARDNAVILEELGMTLPHVGHTTQLGNRHGGRHDSRRGGGGGGGRRNDGRGGQQQGRHGGGQQQRPPAIVDDEDEDARFARETAEAAQQHDDEDEERDERPTTSIVADDRSQDEGDDDDAERAETPAVVERAARGGRGGRGGGRGGRNERPPVQPIEADVEDDFEGRPEDSDEPQDTDDAAPQGEVGNGGQTGEGTGGGKRRRRRRGRRGRGGGGQGGGDRPEGAAGGGEQRPAGDRQGGNRSSGDRAPAPVGRQGGGDRQNNNSRQGGGRPNDNVPAYDRGRRSDGSFENVTELETVDFGDEDEDSEPQPPRRDEPRGGRDDRNRQGGGRQDNRNRQGGGGGGRQDNRGGGGNAGGRGGPQQPQRPQRVPPKPPVVAEDDEDQHELDGSEHGPDEPNGNLAPGAEPVGEEGDQPRKRRRRRGGRRHRRRRENQMNREGGAAGLLPPSPNDGGGFVTPPSVDDEFEAGIEDEADERDDQDAEVTDLVPIEEIEPPAAQDPASSTSRASTRRRPSPPPAPLPVVKTGSTDKHLVAEVEDTGGETEEAEVIEIVEVEAPAAPTRKRSSSRRPSSYADLDAIPDDYD